MGRLILTQLIKTLLQLLVLYTRMIKLLFLRGSETKYINSNNKIF